MSAPTYLPAFNVAFSADGDATGFITIPTLNSAMSAIGATVFINDNTNTKGQECVVVNVDNTSGLLYLRFVRNEQTMNNALGFGNSGTSTMPTYGKSDCSGYLVANVATVFQPQQYVFNSGGDDSNKGAPLFT